LRRGRGRIQAGRGLSRMPVKEKPDTAEAALRRGKEVLRAMTLTPCAGVTPSEKKTVPLSVP